MAPKAKEAPKADAKAKAKAKPKPKKEENPEDKIPRVEQPDRGALDEALKKVNTEVEALQKKKADLDKRIGERSTGKEEFFQKKQELRAKLDEVQAKIDSFAGKKDELYKQIDNEKNADKEMKAQLQKMKSSVGFSSEAEIDKRIADIEFNMWTSSISLKEEKKLLDEIKELKRSKPKVSKLKGMEAEMEGKKPGTNTESIRADIQKQSADIKEAKEQKRLISAEYAKLNEERQKQMSDMPELFEERQKLQTGIQEKINKRNELRDEFREKEKAYNAYMNEIRKIRAEKAAESRNERQAEMDERRKQRQVEQLDEQPHVGEITLIEQTIAWCKSVLPKEEKTADEGKKKDTVFNNPEGAMVLLKKEDRDEEFYYAPTKKKSAKGKKSKEDTKKTIKHDAATFKLFDQLKLDAPLSTEEIPDIMTKLEEQLEEYNEKVRIWERDRDEMKRKILAGEVDTEKKEEEKKEEEEEKADEE
eukprot:gnl/MRDRNA2_/MRDRNA2_87672_c0_seq1.p1 gnl/MRDRNA2_/MRDRNA2_87672_c0~~gnl/MRDRNA2_/MRDRNA2_87672_c0_seq1.p1  ORF type:complete len:476 (-),score=226.33 gnl/MRDRNA2_/MRDRNA2_87672_c0_seq1:68-1495(-)